MVTVSPTLGMAPEPSVCVVLVTPIVAAVAEKFRDVYVVVEVMGSFASFVEESRS